MTYFVLCGIAFNDVGLWVLKVICWFIDLLIMHVIEVIWWGFMTLFRIILFSFWSKYIELTRIQEFNRIRFTRSNILTTITHDSLIFCFVSCQQGCVLTTISRCRTMFFPRTTETVSDCIINLYPVAVPADESIVLLGLIGLWYFLSSLEDRSESWPVSVLTGFQTFILQGRAILELWVFRSELCILIDTKLSMLKKK